MDKGPTGLVSGMVHQCKFCEKVCTSESGLTNHINTDTKKDKIFSGVANVAANIMFSTCILNIYVPTPRMSTGATSVVSSSRTPTYCHFTALPT